LDKHFDRRGSWHKLSIICSAWTESLDPSRRPAPSRARIRVQHLLLFRRDKNKPRCTRKAIGTSAAASASGQTRMSVKSLSLSLSQCACWLSVPCSLEDTHYRSPKTEVLNSASASVGWYERRRDVNAVDRGGIEGRVIIRPISPPISPTVRPEGANYRPYQATVSVMNQRGQTVTQFQSDLKGRFRLPLEPGRYTLRPESPGPLPRAAEQAVTVSEGQFTEVLIAYDSGIR